MADAAISEPSASRGAAAGARDRPAEGRRGAVPGAGRRRSTPRAPRSCSRPTSSSSPARRCAVAEALERAARRGVAGAGGGRRLRHRRRPGRVAGALEGGRRAVARLQPGARLARAAAAALAAAAPQAVRGRRRASPSAAASTCSTTTATRTTASSTSRASTSRCASRGPLVADAHEHDDARSGCACRSTREARQLRLRGGAASGARRGARRHRHAATAHGAGDSTPRRAPTRAPAARRPACCATTCAFARASSASTATRSRQAQQRDHHRQRLLRTRRARCSGRCCEAAERGVQGARCCCRAATSTSCSTTPAAAMYGVLLRAGVEIIEYAPSFLHAKVAVVDGPLGAIAPSARPTSTRSACCWRARPTCSCATTPSPPSCAATCSTRCATTGARIDSAAHMKRPFTVRSAAPATCALRR